MAIYSSDECKKKINRGESYDGHGFLDGDHRANLGDEKKLIVLLEKYRKKLEQIKIEYSKLKKLHGQAVNNSIISTHSRLLDDFNK
ncbi:MAG: hypothetical protein MJ252_30430 [archaeon]|nr:hypothetical protein [archaeon]